MSPQQTDGPVAMAIITTITVVSLIVVLALLYERGFPYGFFKGARYLFDFDFD